LTDKNLHFYCNHNIIINKFVLDKKIVILNFKNILNKMAIKKSKRHDLAYLKMAREWGNLSYCERKKVGALIVKNRRIISDGYNGTPTGFDNTCEDENYNTKWHVLHAEANAISKVAASAQNSEGATLYVTMSPCKECSKLIYQAGIKRVVYYEHYNDTTGIDFLRKAGVEVEQIEELDK
jgi:dCMP deaminase